MRPLLVSSHVQGGIFGRMSLEEILRKAVEHIDSGLLRKETQVRDTVINPILKALDWDVGNPERVRTEYEVLKGKEGSVDYALLREKAPVIFIEAKKLGGIKKAKKPRDEDSREQLFNYYYADRRPEFLILTDGKRWFFYLGKLEEEEKVLDNLLFHEMELTSREEVSKYVSFFRKYLERKQIVSYRSALKAAENVYKKNQDRKITRDAIPSVWLRMLETPNQKLRDLLAKEVRNELKSKLKPDDLREEVEAFLKEFASEAVPPTSRSRSSKPVPASAEPKAGKGSKFVGFVLDGKDFATKNSIETLAKILKEFSGRESGFMERFAEKTKGKERPLVSKDRDKLYARPNEAHPQAEDLKNGWWLQKGTNAKIEQIKKHIEIACEVAGVKFGSQLELIEPDAQ